MNSQRTAYFGATGGCTNACLAFSLRQGLKAVALARTPKKLHDMLLAQGISEDTISANLIIIQGDVTDIAAVKKALMSGDERKLVDKIVSGVGARPSIQLSLTTPVKMDNPHICEQAITTIIKALGEIYAEYPDERLCKPIITVISTTGVDGPDDVPFGFKSLYSVLLAVPHEDKKKLEELVKSDELKDESSRVFGGAVIVRPSLLVGDHQIASIGSKKLRVGTEENPPIGYTVHRARVGQWIFEEVVTKSEVDWVGKIVTLTY
ncbi:uncharacterized protein NFIA_099810 [Aspergillus fischeri NRRL 181]|uniref:Uncharacterized protein n=1 Tax=Neosartorya fischeri (strain ATCC 1020 / DSM 3700 / CBS 544.65 / FGSC A1164 / JCM 1740 / NRRL 181 / WB 181) TaxID=331117 RepID=A1DBV5_NEOFI|nr:conserved hypothetical protein [Aspergillus fischeri NRRL 181]EAW20345.1 conserved hypothetical protein [Aspergillus fischeri NRRL 181]KAG2007887.1 hypothetical protein GB937_008078 [Aspergillus fischeri]